jgi:hypothetical protein
LDGSDDSAYEEHISPVLAQSRSRLGASLCVPRGSASALDRLRRSSILFFDALL